MIRLAILFLIVVILSLVAGVRVHPKAITALFESVYEGDIRRIYLDEGNFMVGTLVEETETELKIGIGSGTVSMPKDKIAKIEKVTQEELNSGAYQAWFKKKKHSPLITRREEDSIMPWIADTIADLIGLVQDRMAPTFKRQIPEQYR